MKAEVEKSIKGPSREIECLRERHVLKAKGKESTEKKLKISIEKSRRMGSRALAEMLALGGKGNTFPTALLGKEEREGWWKTDDHGYQYVYVCYRFHARKVRHFCLMFCFLYEAGDEVIC